MNDPKSSDEKDNGDNICDIERHSEDATGNENVVENNNTSTFDFTERNWRTDFVLIVEGTRLHVAKNILSLASPVFDRMFESEFKESSSNEVELPGKKLCDVTDFLRCIYPNTFTLISNKTAINVLPLIEEYQVMVLKPKCEEVMLERIHDETPVEELFELLRVACMYNLKKLRGKCVSQASVKPQDELDKALNECPPPAEGLNEILMLINRKMRANLEELAASNHEIIQQNEKSITSLQEANSKFEEELKLLKQYLIADMRRTKDVKLDGEFNWKETHVVLLVDTITKDTQSKEYVTIWDIPLTVTVSFSKRAIDKCEKLYVDIEKVGKKKIFCKYKARFVLVNRQPNGLNESFSAEGHFSSYYQWIREALKNKTEITDTSKGFVIEGKIGVIIQLYLSEPNQE